MKKLDIVIDFDGTCVAHDFPRIGKDIGAVPILKRLVESGHRLILFTMRSNIKNPTSNDPDIHCIGGYYLNDAISWFSENGIKLWGIQTNPEQHKWTNSPKAYGHLIIDDAALGCPLKFDPEISDRPFADWLEIEKYLVKSKII